jgi:hypothetical protein
MYTDLKGKIAIIPGLTMRVRSGITRPCGHALEIVTRSNFTGRKA